MMRPGHQAGGGPINGLRRRKAPDFLAGGEGAPPPVFAGRETVLGDIENNGSQAWKGPGAPKHGKPKATRIVQGAPGAGKSSILAELVKRSGERAGAPGQSRVVVLSSEKLVIGLQDAIRTIAVAGGMSGERWRRLGGKLTIGANAFFAHADGEVSWAADARTSPDSLHGLAKRFPPQKWQAPVIVAVDEAQNVGGDRFSLQGVFLQGFHTASDGLPLTLVLAGLGDTQARAMKLGLTRGLDIHEIGALSETEPNDLMTGFCRHFGMDPSGHEARLAALAKPCEGWPRHLHFAAQALGRAVLEADGDLGCVDWNRIEAEAAASRLRYYRSQRSLEMERADILVARVMKGADDNDLGLGALSRLVKGLVAQEEDCELPEGMSADGFLQHLVHQGALGRTSKDVYKCPIPSFRTHLIEAGGLEPSPTRDEPDDGDWTLPEPTPFSDPTDPNQM